MAIVATHVAAVQELYVAYFGRPADVAGLDYWTNVVEAQGGSTTAVSASFATQPEYIVAFFGKTNAQVVDQIYLNMFGRGTSTTDGRAYWVDLLNKGTVGISTIVAEVANGAQGSDGVAVENKIEAATAFTNALDTEAEQAGYNGPDALAAAKSWIASITTDATLTAAIAPNALNAQVAAVVKAGTPFGLESGIAALRAADKAIADFEKANGLDHATAEATLAGAATTAEGALATAVNATGATYAGTDRQKAAALADAQETLADTAKELNKDLADLRGGASAKAVAAADVLARATAAQTAADKAEDAALVKQNAAEAFVEVSLSGREVTIGATDITIEAATAGGTDVVLARIATNGTVTLANGITEAAYPGVGALVTAVSAYKDALAVQAGAVKAVGAANDAIALLSTDDQADVALIGPAAIDAAAADKAVTDLAKLVSNLAAAETKVDAYDDLLEAQETAIADFADGGYLAPVTLTAASAALTGSDVFLLGSDDAVTLSNFGASGDDVIYVGKNYTLNSGAITTGNDTAMEVFFVQNGNRAEVHVEKAAYGSTSDDVIVISLVGVDAADLQLTDGVISLKDA
jgi:hypothetical protein